MSDDNKWSKPDAPPPPLFLGKKERDLVKQINDELVEKVIGQQILYYPIDLRATDFHELYGEAIKKTYLPPIRVYALVEFTDYSTDYMESAGIDKSWEIMIHLYGDYYYEIISLSEPKLLFGQAGREFEIAAQCKRARKGLFDAS